MRGYVAASANVKRKWWMFGVPLLEGCGGTPRVWFILELWAWGWMPFLGVPLPRCPKPATASPPKQLLLLVPVTGGPHDPPVPRLEPGSSSWTPPSPPPVHPILPFHGRPSWSSPASTVSGLLVQRIPSDSHPHGSQKEILKINHRFTSQAKI